LKFIEEFLDKALSEETNPVQKVLLHVRNSNERLQLLKIRDMPMSTTGRNQQQINRSKCATTNKYKGTEYFCHVTSTYSRQHCAPCVDDEKSQAKNK
jgi:hypothetical protein